MSDPLFASFLLLVAARIEFLRKKTFDSGNATLNAMIADEYEDSAARLEALAKAAKTTEAINLDAALYDIDYDFLLDVRRHAGVRITKRAELPTPEQAAFAKLDVERAYGVA